MNFTQEQITEILQVVANEKGGLNTVLKVALEVLMVSERKVFQETHDVYANGFRGRKISGFGKEIALSVPRTRNGDFYPVLLGILRDEDEERNNTKHKYNIFHFV